MFWTRNSSSSTSTTDTSSASSVLHSAQNRSMGFFTSLDVRGMSDNSPKTNQSAGETAREVENLFNSMADQELSEAHREEEQLALPPSYVLSEKRRSELLKAARANRTSWIDNNSSALSDPSTVLPWHHDHHSAKISSQCQEALDQIGMEMQSLTSSLEALKRKIIPNDLLASEPEDENQAANGDNQSENDQTSSVCMIADELRVKQTELESWKRVHLVQGTLSAMQRKRLTASDREMLFLLAFQELLVILKLPLAAEIVYQIQIYVKKFEQLNLEAMLRLRALQDRPGGHVQSFIAKIVHQLQRTGSNLFAAANVEILSLDDDEDQLLHEVLEAFLMEKLCTRALTPTTKTEVEDDQLHDRLESLQFVEFRHLDLPIPENQETEHKWHQLIEQLSQVTLFPSPRRKMDCVMRVCQDLTTLLAGLHATHKFPSADEFLPGLIYLLLKANPVKLKRSVHLILEYRNPSRLVSEPGYFFTHVVSSVAYLEQVNSELLTITPEEFENGLRACQQNKTPKLVPVDQVTSTLQEPLERTKSNQRNHQVGHHEERETPAVELRVPTVMEVRAKRLASAVCM